MQYGQQKSKLIGKRACREGKKTPCSRKMLWWETLPYVIVGMPTVCQTLLITLLRHPPWREGWGNFGAACTRRQPLKATSHQIHNFLFPHLIDTKHK